MIIIIILLLLILITSIILIINKYIYLKIAKVALVSHVEARKCLFELLNAGYTYLQVIYNIINYFLII